MLIVHTTVTIVCIKDTDTLKIENMFELRIKLFKVISGCYLAHYKPSFGTLKMRV